MCVRLCKRCRELLCDNRDCSGCSPCNIVLHCNWHRCVRTSDACVMILGDTASVIYQGGCLSRERRWELEAFGFR